MKTKRKALSKKTRFDVFKRDAFYCQYCGAHPPNVMLHVDHIVPVSLGGLNDTDNLITSCEPCNLGKGARRLNVVPQSLGQKAKEVAEREEQLLGFQFIFEGKRQRLISETWRVLEALYGISMDSIAPETFQSTKRFIEKMGLHPVLEAAEITRAKPIRSDGSLFRYFCGACWSMSRELEGAK